MRKLFCLLFFLPLIKNAEAAAVFRCEQIFSQVPIDDTEFSNIPKQVHASAQKEVADLLGRINKTPIAMRILDEVQELPTSAKVSVDFEDYMNGIGIGEPLITTRKKTTGPSQKTSSRSGRLTRIDLVREPVRTYPLVSISASPDQSTVASIFHRDIFTGNYADLKASVIYLSKLDRERNALIPQNQIRIPDFMPDHCEFLNDGSGIIISGVHSDNAGYMTNAHLMIAHFEKSGYVRFNDPIKELVGTRLEFLQEIATPYPNANYYLGILPSPNTVSALNHFQKFVIMKIEKTNGSARLIAGGDILSENLDLIRNHSFDSDHSGYMTVDKGVLHFISNDSSFDLVLPFAQVQDGPQALQIVKSPDRFSGQRSVTSPWINIQRQGTRIVLINTFDHSQTILPSEIQNTTVATQVKDGYIVEVHHRNSTKLYFVNFAGQGVLISSLSGEGYDHTAISHGGTLIGATPAYPRSLQLDFFQLPKSK